METYGKILLVAMPAFLLLVLFEKWYGWKINIVEEINKSGEVLSSYPISEIKGDIKVVSN